MLATYRKVYDWAEKAQRPGGEFDWFAYDADGHIAAFTTAGFGPVPHSVFTEGLDHYVNLVTVIEDKLPHSRALHTGGFQPYAERGLFVYDFRAWDSGQYELSEPPQSPITLSTLLEMGISKSTLVEFRGKFSESALIVPESFWECR